MKSLYKCKYDSKDTSNKKKDIVTKWCEVSCLNGIYNKIEKNSMDPNHLLCKFSQSNLSKSIYNIISTIKHSAYSGENEWRWVNICPKAKRFSKYLDEKVGFYLKGGIKLKEFIKEVWISPHGDVGGSKQVVESYKKKYELDFEIYESKMSYRI